MASGKSRSRHRIGPADAVLGGILEASEQQGIESCPIDNSEAFVSLTTYLEHTGPQP